MKNKTIFLKSRPSGMSLLTDFELKHEAMPYIGKSEILLKTLYVSVDPYLRAKMAGNKTPRFELNEHISSKIIARVQESAHEQFREGDIVSGYLDWKVYQTSDGANVQLIDNQQSVPLSTHLGVLGVTGLSAYFALIDIGQPKPGETLVISGAAGAVGSIAGQIGKLMGCRVIGIAGTDDKVDLLKIKFGFDAAINYKSTPDLKAAVAEACPHGVDIYFDNVGGAISDAVIANINKYGRIPVCGTISSYNDTDVPTGTDLLPVIVYKFLKLQGFLIADYAHKFPKGIKQLSTWLQQGKLTYAETILNGFDKLPDAFIGLFEGKNEGKMIVKI